MASPDVLPPSLTFGTSYRRWCALVAALSHFNAAYRGLQHAHSKILCIAARTVILKLTAGGSVGRSFWLARLDGVASWLQAGESAHVRQSENSTDRILSPP